MAAVAGGAASNSQEHQSQSKLSSSSTQPASSQSTAPPAASGGATARKPSASAATKRTGAGAGTNFTLQTGSSPEEDEAYLTALYRSSAQLAQRAGFSGFERQALTTLAEAACNYTLLLGRVSLQYAHFEHRSNINLDDLGQCCDDLHLPAQQLELHLRKALQHQQQQHLDSLSLSTLGKSSTGPGLARTHQNISLSSSSPWTATITIIVAVAAIWVLSSCILLAYALEPLVAPFLPPLPPRKTYDASAMDEDEEVTIEVPMNGDASLEQGIDSSQDSNPTAAAAGPESSLVEPGRETAPGHISPKSQGDASDQPRSQSLNLNLNDLDALIDDDLLTKPLDVPKYVQLRSDFSSLPQRLIPCNRCASYAFLCELTVGVPFGAMACLDVQISTKTTTSLSHATPQARSTSPKAKRPKVVNGTSGPVAARRPPSSSCRRRSSSPPGNVVPKSTLIGLVLCAGARALSPKASITSPRVKAQDTPVSGPVGKGASSARLTSPVATPVATPASNNTLLEKRAVHVPPLSIDIGKVNELAAQTPAKDEPTTADIRTPSASTPKLKIKLTPTVVKKEGFDPGATDVATSASTPASRPPSQSASRTTSAAPSPRLGAEPTPATPTSAKRHPKLLFKLTPASSKSGAGPVQKSKLAASASVAKQEPSANDATSATSIPSTQVSPNNAVSRPPMTANVKPEPQASNSPSTADPKAGLRVNPAAPAVAKSSTPHNGKGVAQRKAANAAERKVASTSAAASSKRSSTGSGSSTPARKSEGGKSKSRRGSHAVISATPSGPDSLPPYHHDPAVRMAPARTRMLPNACCVISFFPKYFLSQITWPACIALVHPIVEIDKNGFAVGLPPIVGPVQRSISRKKKITLDDVFGTAPLNAENYNKIIARPMDFNTVRSRLEANLYQDIQSFDRDLTLIANNCKTYTGKLDAAVTKEYKEYVAAFEGAIITNLPTLTKQLAFVPQKPYRRYWGPGCPPEPWDGVEHDNADASERRHVESSDDER
ncbi:uncharacterized protein MONBRDRAFT_8170 [Monosiga brevicollis MX1]|uniref:Bromo domain-containing protein n=1 Tax=Monosiga brevicollis TaxID=81824 RepID=A9UZ88_MONBE|nr:uncharacterized protein MONBRDRAFT_8170 [Monosiga brevicollis MX1]EDQ89192.1 predicted protein [Monosiga brevicollis MX1]|eukprot:XP_001745768.1 hypothetical protein [Monosiga brevicollis MX1]